MKNIRLIQDKKEISIPIAELAPGMIRIWQGGEAKFVHHSELNPEKAPINYPELPEIFARVSIEIDRKLEGIYGCPPGCFARDHNPDRELLLSHQIATVYEQFASGRPLDLQQKNDICQVVIVSSVNGEAAQYTVDPRTISARSVKTIMGAMSAYTHPEPLRSDIIAATKPYKLALLEKSKTWDRPYTCRLVGDWLECIPWPKFVEDGNHKFSI